jgi:rubrerythrin
LNPFIIQPVSLENWDIGEVYICPVCGFTHIGEPPDRCPVCNVKKERFKVFS